MNTYRIAFQTADFFHQSEPLTFSCVTHGFADHHNWIDPDTDKSALWNEELKGNLLSGKYNEVLAGLESLKYKPKLCIALFARNAGIELFLNHFAQIMPDVILAGGVAAITDGKGINPVIPLDEDIRLLSVAEGRFEFQSLNIYEKTGIKVEIKKTSNREFELLRVIPGGSWQHAADFYRSRQKDFNVEEGNFESLTFSDRNERNLHFSITENTLHAGADLPDDNVLILRVASKKDVEERVAGFLLSDHSLIFGCAGIRSLIQKPLFTGQNSIAGFMFGEIVSVKHKAAFGNLMLTKIKIPEE